MCVQELPSGDSQNFQSQKTRVGGPVSTHSVPLHPALVPPHPADQTIRRVTPRIVRMIWISAARSAGVVVFAGQRAGLPAGEAQKQPDNPKVRA